MQKSIKIFLGSSIVEFERERQDIENFLYRISRDFEKRYNVSIEPLLCENFDDAYTKIRKQEEYNEIVRESDMCVFIFFTKVGEYTHEEFEVARKKFEETGKPKIYTYFKTINDGTVEQSVQDFMTELDSAFQHYYGNFEHIDTVKLRILLNLKLQELDVAEIEVDSDNCVVDGKKVLSLKNVSEFANNRILQEFTEELKEVEEKYFTLRAKYETGAYTSNEERQYIEIATRRQTLLDAIEELRKNIFNMSLRMCKDEIRGEITLRQKEAYRLFELGDLEGANSILDFSEIKNEYMRRKAIREAEQKKDAKIFIRESRTKIEILTAMTNLPTRFDEIESIYDEITEIAFEENVELEVVFDFVWFLYEQNKHQNAYDIGKKLEKYICTFEKFEKARIYDLLGLICYVSRTNFDEAEGYFKKSMKEMSALLDKDKKYIAEMAKIFLHFGSFFNEQNKFEDAEILYKSAVDIFKGAVEEISPQYIPTLAHSYNNLGNLYLKQNNLEKAEENLREATKIKETLANEISDIYNADVANSYVNMGTCLYLKRQYQEAGDFYNKALSLYQKLTEENPERFRRELSYCLLNIGFIFAEQFMPQKAEEYFEKATMLYIEVGKRNSMLAESYFNIGVLYEDKNNTQKAEDCFKKSIAIYEECAQNTPKEFNYPLARGYHNIASFYKEQSQNQNADKYFEKSFATYEQVAKENLEILTFDDADSYIDIGLFYEKQDYLRANNCFVKALEIYEALSKKDPKKYELKLASIYIKMGTHYLLLEQNQRSETYYEKGFEIYEKDPEKNHKILAETYSSLSEYLSSLGHPQKAETFCKKSIDLYEELDKTNPGKYCLFVGQSYENLAKFYDEQGQKTKAEEYYNKAATKIKEFEKYSDGQDIVGLLRQLMC